MIKESFTLLVIVWLISAALIAFGLWYATKLPKMGRFQLALVGVLLWMPLGLFLIIAVMNPLETWGVLVP